MRHLPALLCLLLVGLPKNEAKAAESYDNCTGFVDSVPAVITTQGTWCLRADLSTALTSGAALTISTNNVTLDCNDFKLGGLAGGPSTLAIGVESVARLNHTVRNCTIRGFYRGVRLHGAGSGHLVEGNRLEGNTHVGIHVIGSNTAIRDNLVLDTGGSTESTSIVYGILAQGDGMQILDNTVTGVQAVNLASGTTRGIYFTASGNGDADIGRNWVQGLTEGSQGTVVGIDTVGGRPIIHENRLHGPINAQASFGVRCNSASGLARVNLIHGFINGIGTCTTSANVVVSP